MATSSTAVDVAIIGGGVIGCATAYFLAADHGLRCTVIERDGIGAHASGGAAGELSPYGRSGAPPLLLRFGMESIKVHRALSATLQEESGMEYQLADIPILRPAFTPEEADHLLAQVGSQQKLGMEASWVDADTLRSMRTWLPPQALGALSTQEVQLETYPFALALARAAARHGVEIRTGEVTGLLRSGNRTVGVLAGQEPVPAQTVIVANGPWSGLTGAWLGYDIPVKPLKGQIVHLSPPAPLPQHAIFHQTGYLLPKAGGSLMAGTTEEDAGFASEPTKEGQTAIMEAVAKLAPMVARAQIREVTACLRPLSLDGLPFIGPAPGWEGLYLATGHGHKGILLCLATGKYLAQLMVHGRSDYPLDAFSPERLAVA